jgi:hypothetical protein
VFPDVIWIVAALGVALLVALGLLVDEQKAALERALLRELREVQSLSEELWDALGPGRYRELVSAYGRRREIFVRADLVVDYWDRAARAFLSGKVNRKRFLARIAPRCESFWRDYAALIAHLDDGEPQRVRAWRRLHRAAASRLGGSRRPAEIEPTRAA